MQLSKGKVVLVLAAVVLLLAATPIFAQGPQFSTGSANPTLRSEGLTETVGNVSMVTTGAGTIPAGSSITITYSQPITNASSIGFSNVTVTGGQCIAAANPALCPDVVAASASQVTLSYTTARPFASAGLATIVSGVRVNASAAGQGTKIEVNLEANPSVSASFTNAGPLPVGTVFNGNSTAVTLTAAAGPLLTCTIINTNNAFTVSVKESFGSALTSRGDEDLLSTTPVPTNGSRIQITYAGAPAAVTITLGTLPAGLTLTSISTDLRTFTFEPIGTNACTTPGIGATTCTNKGAIETYAIPFSVTTGAALTPGSAGAISATIKLAPITTTAGTIVRFAENTQGSGTVATLTDCVTNLLFPWVLNAAGFDTGIAIANTTKDAALGLPAAGAAVAQSGTCKLTALNAADGTTAGTFTTTSIPAGGTGTLIVSAAFPGFAGHVFAVCQFLDAHGFAYITDNFGAGAPATAQGYLALVIPNNATRGASNGESLNQ